MSSRKMCVALLLILTILWGLSAGNVLAQGQHENKGASASASSAVSNPPSESTSSSNSTSTSGTAGAQQTTGTAGTTPATPGKPGTFQYSRPAPRMTGGGYGVMVGPNGQVLEFGEGVGGGGGGFGGGSGGGGGGFQGGPPLNPNEYNKARADLMRTQEELRRLQRSLSIAGPNQFFLGQAMPGPFDPETRALEEKEQKIAEDVQKTADQYKSATDKEERAKLKKQLEELSGQQFDIRQQYRELEVKRLENELARIRDSIQKRTENREQIIKRRVAQLVHEEEDLEF